MTKPDIAWIATALTCIAMVFLAAPSAGLVTKVFIVPPDFVDRATESIEADPFALPGVKQSHVLSTPGWSWPEGAGAVIDRRTNQMAVRHTKEMMGRIEAYVADIDAEWKKDPKPVVYFDEVTFAASRRKRDAAGKFQEAVYRLPASFTTQEFTKELQSQGVDLPTGSEAVFDAKQNEVRLRNTEANLDLAVMWIAQIWVVSKEVPPFQAKAPDPVRIENGHVDEALRDLAAKKLPGGK